MSKNMEIEGATTIQPQSDKMDPKVEIRVRVNDEVEHSKHGIFGGRK